MVSGIKLVSTNVSSEFSCELAASSTQNSLPGGSSIAANSSQDLLPGSSFMVVNIDMKKVLKGSCTYCVPVCYSNTKSNKKLSFLMFPRDVSLRVKWVNSIGRKNFIPGLKHCVCSQHFHGTRKQGRSLLHFHCFLSQNRKNLKNAFLSEPPAKKKKLELENQNPRRCCCGRSVFFCVDLLVPMRRKELIWS